MTAAADHDVHEGLLRDAGAFEVGDEKAQTVRPTLTDEGLIAHRGRSVALRGNSDGREGSDT